MNGLEMDGIFGWWLTLTITFVFMILFWAAKRKKKGRCSIGEDLPSPPRLPILGHLHLLSGNPFLAMTRLSQKYGDIYYLQLGSIDTVVLNSLSLIKSVLVRKGSDFGHRPNFLRYNVLFGGDKENSLAFCNYSEVQKTRRSLARRFCHSGVFNDSLQHSIKEASNWLVKTMSKDLITETFPHLRLKFNIQKACANMFFSFFCSLSFDDKKNPEFESIVKLFDDIFWEINQSHATDVLPILAPFFRGHLNRLADMGKKIRAFILDQVINPRLKELNTSKPKDFVNALLSHLGSEDTDTKLSTEQVLYELEDFIGGHSAISNLFGRALIEIASVKGLSQIIYCKYYEEGNTDYLKAVVYETLRKTCSPIVPQVASKDCTIAGYAIKKGTMVIFNSYDLNLNSELWDQPEKFLPERFIDEYGDFHKPLHFLPFSIGKRACMGYRLVEEVTISLIAAIIEHFDIVAMENPNKLPVSCVAIDPKEDIRVNCIPRKITTHV